MRPADRDWVPELTVASTTDERWAAWIARASSGLPAFRNGDNNMPDSGFAEDVTRPTRCPFCKGRLGSFIFGLPSDRPATFDATAMSCAPYRA